MNIQTEALSFSLENELDYHRLLVQLASSRPQFLIELLKPNMDRFAADFLRADPEHFLNLAQQQVANMQRISEFVEQMKAGAYVSCIKIIRETHALGLKEAKDIVIYVRDKLYTSGKLTRILWQTGAATVNGADLLLAEALISAF